MSDIAPVGDDALRRIALAAIFLQIAPWFDLRVPFERIDSVTWASCSHRPNEYIMSSDVFRSADDILQRPASTQETGITVVCFAGARIVRFKTRFCFAPISSSPSTRRTGSSALFSRRSSETEPPA